MSFFVVIAVIPSFAATGLVPVVRSFENEEITTICPSFAHSPPRRRMSERRTGNVREKGSCQNVSHRHEAGGEQARS